MPGRSRFSSLAVLPIPALFAFAVTGAGQAQTIAPGSSGLTVEPLRASAMYGVGERAGWRVAIGRPDATGTVAGKWTYTLLRNGATPIVSGEIVPGAPAITIATEERAPAMLLLKIQSDGSRNAPSRVYGAAVSPTGLRPVAPSPGDLDAFWSRKIAELHRIPENAVITPMKSPLEGVEYGTIRMDHVNGTGVYGQIARPAPRLGEKPGKYPAILQMQWASPPYPLDPWWILNRAKQGFIVLNIEPHNVLPTEPPAYYAALPDALKNYGTIGQDDRDRSYFVEMYLRDVRAAEYLTRRPDWNGKVLIATGGSMGGQQTLAVAALCPRITHAIAEEPAGCDLAAPLHGRAIGYPFFDPKNPRIVETARYVDNVNLAPRIRAKTLIGIGFIDEICPPAGIWTAYNAIRGPKEAAPLPEAPHNNTATPAQMSPFRSRAEEWYAALARGEDVKPRGAATSAGK